MMSTLTIRLANEADLPFIRSLSPTLAAKAGLSWHTDDVVQKFQDDYIDAMMADTDVPNATYVAARGDELLGFVHVRGREDEVSGEAGATMPLLAVKEGAQGLGVGQALMAAAEDWTKAQGWRLLHLEVFWNNAQGRHFYEKQGYEAETINLIKAIG
ncbi:MAG: GNAT family N-acetyltransferase [Alphaproteobacteria bacterium]|nr:GNAT family N-acetyltransferase [Alphaproteobacteria bacterium]